MIGKIGKIGMTGMTGTTGGPAMNRRTRALLTGLVVAAVATTAPAVAAAAAPQRLALRPFQGPGADHLRTAMIARLPRRLQVLPAEQTDRADAVVEGQIWTGKTWKVRLTVRSQKTGAAAGTLVWSGTVPRTLIEQVLREAPPKLEARVGAMMRQQRLTANARVRSARRQVLSAATTAPATVIQDDRRADASADTDTDTDAPVAHAAGEPRGKTTPRLAAGGPLLEVSVGAGTIGRTLTFADNLAAAPGYSLPAASTLGGELVVFPGARLGGWTGMVGLAGAWESTIAASTASRDGHASHPTRHIAYGLGARGRLPFERATLLAGQDLGQQRFDVDLPGATLSPAVRYRFLRPSLGGRLAIDDFALTLSAAYLQVLSADLGGTVFPRAQVRGFELGARLGYDIADELAVELRLDFRRFAHAMNARPGDAMLVGGAVDDYLAAALRLSYRVW